MVPTLTDRDLAVARNEVARGLPDTAEVWVVTETNVRGGVRKVWAPLRDAENVVRTWKAGLGPADARPIEYEQGDAQENVLFTRITVAWDCPVSEHQRLFLRGTGRYYEVMYVREHSQPVLRHCVVQPLDQGD